MLAAEKLSSPLQIVIVLLNLITHRTNSEAGRACNPSLLIISTSLRMRKATYIYTCSKHYGESPCLPRLGAKVYPEATAPPSPGAALLGEQKSWEPCPFPPDSFVDTLKGRCGGFTKANLTPNFATMIKKILIAVAILIVVLVIVVVLQPSEFRVTRTATVSAPPEVVFDQVNDLHKYQTWSPFAKVDPAMKTTLEGPAAGTGAVLAWAGNSKAGEGRMTLTESRPNELVRFNLEFFKPFKATNIAEFTFKPEGDQTVVTWSMTGKNNFMFKAVGLFMNCDKMVGGMFEEGLANLKTIAEAETKG